MEPLESEHTGKLEFSVMGPQHQLVWAGHVELGVGSF